MSKTMEFTSALHECLEKYAADGLKRELDFEEAVWRTLPPFVTALGLLGALLSYLISKLSADWASVTSVLAAVLTGGGLICTAITLWQLRFAVKARKHRYPPSEIQVCNFAQQRREYHVAAGDTQITADAAALKAVKAFILEEVVATVSHNHVVNAEKMNARTRAARWLFFAVVFTLLAAGVTAFRDSPLWTASGYERQAKSPAPSAAAAPTTSAAAALGREGQRSDPHAALGATARSLAVDAAVPGTQRPGAVGTPTVPEQPQQGASR